MNSNCSSTLQGQMLPVEYGNILVEAKQPTVSAQRRLQNRVAQRKFRERKAQKAKTLDEKLHDLASMPYEETLNEAESYSFSEQHSNQQFDYSLDCLTPAHYNEACNLLSPNFSIPPIDLEAQSNSSYWYTPTAVGIDMPHTPPSENVYFSSRPSNGQAAIPLLSGSNELHQPIPRPPNISSRRQEAPAYRTPPRSNANSPPPPMTAASSASATLTSNPSGPHHIGRHSPYNASSTGTLEDANTKPPSPLLHVAIRSRNRAVIHVLLRRGAASIDDRDAEGRTALHVAAGLGDEALVSLLLGQGADPRLLDSNGRPPLYHAVEKGHSEIVEMLLDQVE